MISRYTQKHCSWVDLFEPTHDEVREIMEAFDLPPRLVSDLTGPVPRSDAVRVADTLKVTLDFPSITFNEQERPQEVKFILTKHALITVRYADIPALHQFAKEFEVATTLKRTARTLHGGHLFTALLRALYAGLGQKLDYIETRLADIEEEIFNEHEKEMVFEISQVNRRLITFRQTLASHELVLARTREHAADLFSKQFAHSVGDLELTFQNLMRQLTAVNTSTLELRETNNSLLYTKQNETMKVLTIMAFVTFPLTLFSSLFGMNTKTLPLVGIPGDFWYILGIMVLLTVLFFGYFRYKRWM